ncbi:MAG: NFACT family protein [Oscillospiraceae bacterium]|jgi:predicted ribosome quality control (RQC) complex YloA/Tae2 family protein|nr:NFACT family protein [Oscillospiraceae bacterium]
MALDGIFLSLIKEEIKREALGARVEKVHQPAKNEIVLAMRSRSSAFRLLLSCSGNAPRIHLTSFAPDNPQNPPMLCMLFRKHLTGAILEDVTQMGLDRVLFLHFNATNEIGDRVKRVLAVEIMAQHSNIILLDENDVIIDSVKRVDHLHSSVREVLPGLAYALPPAQSKLDIRKSGNEEIITALKQQKGKSLSAALLALMQGMSPVLCRELAFRAYGEDVSVTQEMGVSMLSIQLDFVRGILTSQIPVPCAVADTSGKLIDFSFLPVTQYGRAGECRYYETLSKLLDAFYHERERFARTKSKAEDLFRFLNNAIERTTRKINNQKTELEQSENRDEKRVFAELIQANLYRLEKGSVHYVVENYYDDNNEIKIPAKPHLTPVQNAQQYFKEYRKAQTAEGILKEQIASGEADLEYFFTVLDALSRSETERELAEIREELQCGGYLKKKNAKPAGKQKKQAPLPPLQFTSPDGFSVLVGRNNVQNEKLSLKTAQKTDLWFHAQKMPGSHVVLSLEGREPTAAAIGFAASLAAYYSSGRQSNAVSVDCTEVKQLKKPNGGKPGFVIYHVYKTLQAVPFHPAAGG